MSIVAQPSPCVESSIPSRTLSLCKHVSTLLSPSPLLFVRYVNPTADVTGTVIPSPTFSAVVTAVAHAYYIIQEQREAGEACVARQSVYCDSDMEIFEVSARDESVAALASTTATFEVSVMEYCRCIKNVAPVFAGQSIEYS